jgi:hypothetical protein
VSSPPPPKKIAKNNFGNKLLNIRNHKIGREKKKRKKNHKIIEV